MDLTNDELIKSWGLGITFLTALISLVWNYINSKNIEKNKKVFEWQKDYFSTKLSGYMTAIDSLYTSFKSVRELIEALKIRGKNVDITEVNECLKELRLDYIQATEFLSITHIYIDQVRLEIFAHNHKNEIRDFLENIRDNTISYDQTTIEAKIEKIKINERIILEKFNELRNTTPELFFTKLTK